MSALFNAGEFRLHSGEKSSFKIDCDALTNADLKTLAMLVANRFQWDSVYGIPNGGTRFAAALDEFGIAGVGLPRLLVDDVLTTGQSMNTHRQPRDIGIVIFARSEPDEWVHAMFKMWASPVTKENTEP